MSGNNNNAYPETRRLLLGVGDLYINDVFVGNLKGKVTFKYTREYAYQRAGNNLADQKGECTGEEMTLEAEICDVKLSQLRTAFGVVQAVATAAKTIRKREVVQLNGVIGAALAETPTSGTVKVSSLDRKTAYVTSTDYVISGGGIERAPSGSGITSGQWVAVEYDFSDAGAMALAFGGESKPPSTFELEYVHLDSTGKAWMIRLFKAMTTTDFEMAFSDAESGDFTTYNIMFKGLIDTTKPEGQNVGEIVQEDAAS